MSGIAGVIVPLAWVACMAALSVAARAQERRRKKGRATAYAPWRDLGVRLGLRLTEENDLTPYTLQGSLEGFSVQATPGRIQVSASDHWPAGFSHPPASDTERATQLAVLDAPTRTVLAQHARARVADGALTMTFDWDAANVPRSLDALEAALRGALEVAHALDRGGRGRARCLADGMEGVTIEERRERLAILVRDHATSVATREACLAALDDPAAELRLIAARGAGAAGADALLALADESALPFTARAEAVRAWSAHAPRVDASSNAVTRWLTSENPELRLAAIDAACAIRCRLPRDLVARRVQAADPREAAALARLITLTHPTGTEALLLKLLGREIREVGDEALRGLREHGTLDAIPTILPIAKGAWTSPETRLLAREAIEAIRARLGPVEEGRLSVVDDPSAGGSLSETGEGRLGLPPQ